MTRAINAETIDDTKDSRNAHTIPESPTIGALDPTETTLQVARKLVDNLQKLFASTYFPSSPIPVEQIAHDVLNAEIPERFHVLFENFYVAIRHRSFINFYNQLNEEFSSSDKGITKLSPEDLLERFITSRREVTIFRSDLFDQTTHERYLTEGISSRFRRLCKEGTVTRAEHIAKYGYPSLVMNSFNEQPLDHTQDEKTARKSKFFISASYADPDQEGSYNKARCIAPQIAATYHRATLIDRQYLDAKDFTVNRMMNTWKNYSIVTYEIRINEFYVVRQRNGNLITEAHQDPESSGKEMILRDASNQLSTIEQSNQIFECHVEHIPPNRIVAATCLRLDLGLGNLWGSVSNEKLLFNPSTAYPKGDPTWTVLGIDYNFGTPRKDMTPSASDFISLPIKRQQNPDYSWGTMIGDTTGDKSDISKRQVSPLDLFSRYLTANKTLGSWRHDEATYGVAPKSVPISSKQEELLLIFHNFCAQAYIPPPEELDQAVLSRFIISREFLYHIDYDAKYLYFFKDSKI